MTNPAPQQAYFFFATFFAAFLGAAFFATFFGAAFFAAFFTTFFAAFLGAAFFTTFFAAFLGAAFTTGFATTLGAGFGAGSSLRAPEITSFKPFAGRKRGFLLALIWIVSPVNGLRPLRALRSTFLNLPKSLIITSSPLARLRVIASKTISTACAASFLLSLKCRVNEAMNWALFIKFPLYLRVNVKQMLNTVSNLRNFTK